MARSIQCVTRRILQRFARIRIVVSSVVLVAATLAAARAHALAIPSVPLVTATTAEPNIMVTLDDSGSMDAEEMRHGNPFSGYIWGRVDTDDTNPVACHLRSTTNNVIYYDPTVRYLPWSKSDGSLWPNANPTAAYWDPAHPGWGNLDLTTSTTWFGVWLEGSDPAGTLGWHWGVRTFFPATYFQYGGDHSWASLWDCADYTRVQITPANAPFPKAPGRDDCAGSTCSYAEEIQNFANWFTYHGSRMLAARAGLGRALSTLGSNVRVGFGTINHLNDVIDGISTNTLMLGVRRFSGAARDAVFDKLYNDTVPGGATPLRRAADDVGQYFRRTDDKGPWSSTPGVSGGTDYSCRKSFHILTTDGYWNSSGASTGYANNNNDGAPGPTITGPGGASYTYTPVSPFSDGRSFTLADVAMYYWKYDLRPDIPNEVPPDSRDPAFWQHLVTFGVSFGVKGTIDPATAFSAIATGATINWPNPLDAEDLDRIDDLLHAAVNSRGGFFSAKNPQEFATALSVALQNIVARIGSAASVAVNSTSISSGSLVFQARYNSGNWSGELLALPVTASGVGAVPVWNASAVLPTPLARKIYIETGGAMREFLWSNLSAADQGLLGSSDVVDFLRGDHSRELSNGGTLRNRPGFALGDIVHSTPAYVKDTNTVYVGANDGMLHAFDGTSGAELFAFIPSALVSRLKNLSDPAYLHDYYVDGDIAVSDASLTPGRHYLVSTLGRGGKGLFVLDVTTPASFGAGNLMWEYFNAADPDLGYMLGRPIIAKMNDGSVRVIVGNGYNSTSKKAVLYLFDLAAGTVQKFDTQVAGDNGMATPGVFDADGDGDVDWIYAGDLKGNVWKIDVSSSSTSAWGFSFGPPSTPAPLFTATDPSGNPQPITAPVTIVTNNVLTDPNLGKRFVFFGTGSYFLGSDPADSQVQSWYGLIDTGTQIAGRIGSSYANLAKREIQTEGTSSGVAARSFKVATSGDMVGKEGWYLDFTTQSGERIVTSSLYYELAEPTLIASSIIPKADPCTPGGDGYVNAINPFTGARLSLGFFDLNDNGNFTDDVVGGDPVGGVDPGVGMPSEPRLVGDLLVVGGSSGKVGSIRINQGLPINKGRFFWREIILE